MTLPRIPAAAVAAGTALDRAETLRELDAIWALNDCDGFGGKAREYLEEVRRSVALRCERNGRYIGLGRAG